MKRRLWLIMMVIGLVLMFAVPAGGKKESPDA